MFLKGAHICEKSKGSADEYSGSSDEQNDNKESNNFEHTISIEIAGSDPVYIVLKSSEEKDKWLYFLKNAAGDAAICGTPFEVLVQRMMTEHRSNGWLVLFTCHFLWALWFMVETHSAD
ncbi:unnamed protein product [Anisakis simplex]|uniref:MAX-1A (inferred by orthology to a C. elegans protein) n=1 Tax=Anisakis simplex TaxID=6269 RepID=A0A0M3JL19_ANISI|nr:unnamed protein product [Anisakis simplex]